MTVGRSPNFSDSCLTCSWSFVRSCSSSHSSCEFTGPVPPGEVGGHTPRTREGTGKWGFQLSEGRAGCEPGGPDAAPASFIGDGPGGHHAGAPWWAWGGHQFTGRHCPGCSQVTGGKTEPTPHPPQQAGTPCRLPAALCILKRTGSYSEWGAGEGHSPGRALAGALSTRAGNRPDLPRSPMSGR